jgi:hypothetical protein
MGLLIVPIFSPFFPGGHIRGVYFVNDGTIVYTYYNRGRMKTAKKVTATAVTYTYNALG